MIEICALASGSNGNCYYIGNSEDSILIDAGINCKQILARMAEVGLDPKKIRGVFITHEHGDHVRGIRVFGKKLDIPAFLTKGTFNALYSTYKPYATRIIQPGIPVEIGSFLVHPFLKNHDASEPISFRVEHNDIHVGVFTDIGEPCENVIDNLNKCHALFLETNYDEKMLVEGSYPYYLKERVGSAVGHLSNKQAFELLKEHGHPNLKCVFLSHLSAENNTPEKAYQEIRALEGHFFVKLTSRYGPAELFSIMPE